MFQNVTPWCLGKCQMPVTWKTWKLTVTEQNIAFVEKAKYMGIWIHKNLRWDTHIYGITTKAYEVYGLVKHTL